MTRPAGTGGGPSGTSFGPATATGHLRVTGRGAKIPSGRAAKLAEAVFGPVQLAGWKAVVAKPPGDKIAAKRPNRAQGVFGCRVIGIVEPSGHAVEGQVG